MDENKLNELLKTGQALKLLYVEDNNDVREATSQLLKKFFNTIGIAINGQDGIQQYLDFYNENQQYYDLVISDINMPDMDGAQMCREIIDINKKQAILIISAHTSSNMLINLIDIGINKFVQKSTKVDELIITLSNMARNILDDKSHKENIKKIKESNINLKHKIKEEIQKNNKLEKLAITDKLTGLYNRLQLDKLLEFDIKKVTRDKTNISIVFIDIDRFKSINDTYGHQVGDKILVNFSNIIQNSIREIDTVGRWGGEEFLIICHNTDTNGALILAENLRKIIKKTIFKDIKSITASFGVATFENGDNIDSLINRADEALYKAKHSGRDKVCI